MGTVIRNFISFAKQYQASPTEENLVHLLRQLDILMGETSGTPEPGFLDPKDPVVAECLTLSLDLLFEPNPSMVSKLFFFFKNLGNCVQLQEYLTCHFHLHNALAVFLQTHGTSEKDSIVLQCLELLEVFSYHAVLPSLESSIEFLLQYLLQEIQTDFSETLVPCLGIFSNLCKNSPAVVAFVKASNMFEKILKRLIEKLGNKSQSVSLHSMIILFALSAVHPVRKTIFSQRNTCGALDIVIKVFNSNDYSTQRTAADLLCSLLTFPQSKRHITEYNKLDQALTAIWKSLLDHKSGHYACNNLTLILSLLNDMRNQALESFLKLAEEEIVAILTSLHSWATNWNCETFSNQVELLAWRLYTEILEELFNRNKIQLYIKFVTPTLEAILTTNFLSNSQFNFDSPVLKQKLLRGIRILEFLLLLSEFEGTHHLLQKISPQLCLVKEELNNLSAISDEDCQDNCVDFVLLLLTILERLRHSYKHLEDIFRDFLNDPQVMPFLANGLSSTSKTVIQKTLDLICSACTSFPFPVDILGEAMVLITNRKQIKSRSYTELDMSIQSIEPNAYINDFTTTRYSLDNSIQQLLSKLDTGLQLKDLPSSDIMEMFENKVDLLNRQLQEQEKVLETKSLALQQSDKLLSHYRCLQVQREAEGQKLRHLLRESEKRSETAKDETKKVVSNHQELKAKLQKSEELIASLQVEREELNEQIMEVTQRLKESQKQVKELTVNNHNLNDLNVVLQKQSDNFQRKQEQFAKDMESLTNDKRTLTKQVKEKELHIKELSVSLHKHQESLDEKNKSHEVLQEKNIMIEEELKTSRKNVEELSLQVSSLRKLCTQNQNTIIEKTQTIQTLNEQLADQKKTQDLITNILLNKTKQ